MTLKELKSLLNKLPKEADDLNVWLGVDSGEGYITLSEVFVGNALHLPLDLDDASDKEIVYLDDSDSPEDAPEGFITCEDGSAWGNVVVLGQWNSKEEYDDAKKKYNFSISKEGKELEKEKSKIIKSIMESQKKLREIEEKQT